MPLMILPEHYVWHNYAGSLDQGTFAFIYFITGKRDIRKKAMLLWQCCRISVCLLRGGPVQRVPAQL